MPPRTLNLEFPLGGVDRRLAYQKQRPFTTLSARNVRPNGTLEGRLRGGSRPGLVKAFSQRPGEVTGTVSGSPTDVDNSVLTATEAVFNYVHIGATLTFDTSGNSYTIQGFTSTTVVTLTRNASGETADDTFKVHGPVRMLTVMRSLGTSGLMHFAEPFNATLSATHWECTDWTGTDVLPAVTSGHGTFNTTPLPTPQRSMILKETAGAGGEKVDANAPYMVELELDISSLVTANAVNAHVKVRLYGKLDSVPVEDVGVFAELNYTIADTYVPTNYIAYLMLYVDGEEVERAVILPPGVINKLRWGILRLRIDGGVAEAWWQGTGLDANHQAYVSADISATTATGKRVGVNVVNDENSMGSLRCDNFLLSYYTTDGATPLEATIVSANGQLWRENIEGTLTQVTMTNMTIAGDRSIMAVDRLGKLYIADYGDVRVENTEDTPSGTIVDGVLDDPDVSDWSALGIETGGDVVEVSNVTGGTGELLIRAVFAIKSLDASGGLTLKIPGGADLGASDDATTCNYRVVRGAKVYDAYTNTVSLWTATVNDDGSTLGSVPVNCPLITVFNSRIVMGGDSTQPGWWFMGRFNDPDDWNYGASVTDRGRAIPGNATNSDAGELALPLSAIVATGEDYCVFSGESEMYLLRGDPGAGGIMGNISRQIGIGSKTAYCQMPDGTLYFLSPDGIWKYHHSMPQATGVSRQKLPTSMIDVVQSSAFTVTMEYDVRFRGIYVMMTHNAMVQTPDFYFWYDLDTDSLWENRVHQDHASFAMTYNAKHNHVLIGCRDGYIRRHDAAAIDDDGVGQMKYVLYGPVALNRGLLGLADSLQVVLADGSDDVSWSFKVGSSPQEASRAAYRATGLASEGVNYQQRVRLSGSYAYILLYTLDDPPGRWSVESVRLKVLPVPAEQRKF